MLLIRLLTLSNELINVYHIADERVRILIVLLYLIQNCIHVADVVSCLMNVSKLAG